MTGRLFLRITNATLEFVGSSNSVKQKATSFYFNSWELQKYIHFPSEIMDKGRPGPADSSFEPDTPTGASPRAPPPAPAPRGC